MLALGMKGTIWADCWTRWKGVEHTWCADIAVWGLGPGNCWVVVVYEDQHRFSQQVTQGVVHSLLLGWNAIGVSLDPLDVMMFAKG